VQQVKDAGIIADQPFDKPLKEEGALVVAEVSPLLPRT